MGRGDSETLTSAARWTRAMGSTTTRSVGGAKNTWRTAALGLVLLSCCKPAQLGNAESRLSVTPMALSFSVYVGAVGEQQLSIANNGAAGESLSVGLDGG